MEEPLSLEKILHLLRKPQRSRKLVHLLTALRKYVNGGNHNQAIETIKKWCMLKHIIGFTQFDSNIRVVDLSLSILGNCCMKASVVLHAVNECNILEKLLRALDKHKKDSIQGRVFRIFGNICDAFEPARLIQKESKVIAVTTQFLVCYATDSDANSQEETYSVPTVSMALRYIRKMLSVLTYNNLIHDHKLITTIGMVLIKCASIWQLNQNNDVLITDVLKILQIITSPSYKYNNLIRDLKTTPKGDALTSLGEIILIQPERITKIILRLARLSKNLSDLPVVLIVSILIKQVEEQGHTANGSQSHLLSCVSNLMDHLGFQDMFKNANIAKTLIKLLENYNCREDWSINCCIYLCQSLIKCKYNEELLNSQLQSNVVAVIVAKLEELTGKSSEKIALEEHEAKEYKGASCKRMKLNEENFRVNDVDRSDRCASPSSCSDISTLGPFSPAATSNFAGDDSDSDNYSPLCSETECDDECKDESEEIQELAASDTDENRPALTQDQMELRCKLRSELCTLLKLFCGVKPMPQLLGDNKVLTIVMNLMLGAFVNDAMMEKECSIIKSITLTHNFLIPFMISGVISQVYEILDIKHTDLCNECEVLQCKAKQIISHFLNAGTSNGIKGDIAHILLAKDDLVAKAKISLAIPYVIRKKETLVNLLLDCGGLKILMHLLKDENLQDKSLKAICTLATTSLKIRNPIDRKQILRKTPKTETVLKIGSYQLASDCKNMVTFLLDDDSRVQADRDELNTKSDYFRALLGGSFMESTSDEVRLQDVSCEALKCLLEILKTDYTSSCSFIIDYNLDAILEVMMLSDRFLLSTLNSLMMSHVQQAISLTTVPTIYKWSIDSGTNMLRVDSIAFALVNDNSYNDKLELFRCLFEIGYTTELVDDISDLIGQFLSRLTNVC